jgi:hypothetical protein
MSPASLTAPHTQHAELTATSASLILSYVYFITRGHPGGGLPSAIVPRIPLSAFNL